LRRARINGVSVPLTEPNAALREAYRPHLETFRALNKTLEPIWPFVAIRRLNQFLRISPDELLI
jgi:hypothetical protein